MEQLIVHVFWQEQVCTLAEEFLGRYQYVTLIHEFEEIFEHHHDNGYVWKEKELYWSLFLDLLLFSKIVYNRNVFS